GPRRPAHVHRLPDVGDEAGGAEVEPRGGLVALAPLPVGHLENPPLAVLYSGERGAPAVRAVVAGWPLFALGSGLPLRPGLPLIPLRPGGDAEVEHGRARGAGVRD